MWNHLPFATLWSSFKLGHFSTGFEREELFATADKYQVETLIDLCKPVTVAEIEIFNCSF